ncbi:CocE/NonD family hydrolase [Lichenihabitans sp. PAMC28606]|uniref:CocE/NonD family hydrolase n=1 Tax=Lichenihabitans sp. PAMC28606 TaxID=2880932 RepID=UPI001D09EF43|nr:CocE/NonD family hydrolase [Lichenihabitans sp. PAMC28606]UDL94353.1 CocE/NonD family hydrolase [Lichenihabitans sp. PAMC28606]
MTSDVDVTENLWIPLRDGTRLAARLWLPATAGAYPVPAILEYIPYRKRDGTRGRDEPMHGFFAAHGYAAIRVDMRGSGESDGLLHDEYAAQEQDDALEVIAWIAAQPWCEGGVGLMGKSWGGFNALQIAARRPPALKAIITVYSTDDRYADDIHYMGGCLLNDNLWWGTIMMAFQARPPDPAIVGAGWRDAWLDRLVSMPFWPALWMAHPTRDAYWRHGSICEDFSAITVPVLAIGGWADSYTNAVPRLLEGLSVPRLGLIGPWAHIYPHDGVPTPAFDFLGEATRWWDHWLKGRDTGLMHEPMLRAYIEEHQQPATSRPTSPGRFVGETVWPSPAIETRRFHLGPGTLGAATHQADASLSIRSPLWTGTTCGEWMGTGVPGEMAADQRPDDGLSMVFDTEPLVGSLEVLGNPDLELDLSSDLPHAQIAVRLCDVAPDGSSLRVSYAVLNLAHRDGSAEPRPLVPGQATRLRVRLKMCGHRFAPGHRIRIAVSTAYWPLVWPSRDAATLTIATGASALLLPVRTLAPDERLLLPPPVATPQTPHTKLSDGALARTVTLDRMNNVATYETIGQGGLFGEGVVRWDEIGTSLSHDLKRRLTIAADDPTSATATLDQSYVMDLDGMSIAIETVTSLRAGHDAFVLTGSMTVRQDGDVVRTRDWEQCFSRDTL